MSSVPENAYLRDRLRQIDQLFPEPSTFGQCDCTSYSYIALSVGLFGLGIFITLPALGYASEHVYFFMREMWQLGLILIFSGLIVGVRSVLYVRKKGIMQMLLRQRALQRFAASLALMTGVAAPLSPPSPVLLLLRTEAANVTESLQELAEQSQNQQPSGGSCNLRNPSEDTLPPTYLEALMGDSASRGGGGGGSTEAPPPTYEEAMSLIRNEKLGVLGGSKYAASSEDEVNKRLQGATAVAESASSSQHVSYEVD